MPQDNEFIRQKLKTSEFKDIALEKTIIAGTLKYKEVLRRCSREVSEDYFSSDRCRWIYYQILKFYENENLPLNSDAFKIIVQSKPHKERDAYVKLWDSILRYNKKITRAAAIASMIKMETLYKARLIEMSMATTLQKLSKAIKGGGDNYIEEAKDEYIKVCSKLETKKLVVHVTEPLSLYHDFKKKHIEIQKNPSLLQAIPTGITELDQAFGGLRPSEFGLITAGTGVGKSIMMLDFAFHCFMAYGSILYVTIEMPENQLRERFYCRMSGIEYSNFRKYALSEKHWSRLDTKIKNLDKHENKFHILDIPQSCTVRTLKDEIEAHIKKHGEPKLILIDYLNIMQGGFDWSKQLEIAVQVKQYIARYFKIATWSANQLTGSKHDKENIGIADMGFAKNIADNVDIGIGLGLTDASEDDEIFRISFTKARDFKGKGFNITGDRNRMTFSNGGKKSETKFKSKDIGKGEVTV